jgi:hypothetical protein
VAGWGVHHNSEYTFNSPSLSTAGPVECKCTLAADKLHTPEGGGDVEPGTTNVSCGTSTLGSSGIPVLCTPYLPPLQVQQRGAAIIAARKLSSALSAASSVCDHVRDWVGGTRIPAQKSSLQLHLVRCQMYFMLMQLYS